MAAWQVFAIALLLAPHALYAATALRRRRYGVCDARPFNPNDDNGRRRRPRKDG